MILSYTSHHRKTSTKDCNLQFVTPKGDDPQNAWASDIVPKETGIRLFDATWKAQIALEH